MQIERMHHIEYDFQEKRALRSLAELIEVHIINNGDQSLPIEIVEAYNEYENIRRSYFGDKDEEFLTSTFHNLSIS